VKWRPLSAAERQLALVWGGLVLAVIALKPLWIVVAPLLRPCVFRSITGVPCPTCGATRGALALLDGRLIDGLAFNPLVATAAVLFVVGGVVAPIWAWRRGSAPEISQPLPMWLRIALVVVFLVNWAWVISMG
jgi:hypothetical protein